LNWGVTWFVHILNQSHAFANINCTIYPKHSCLLLQKVNKSLELFQPELKYHLYHMLSKLGLIYFRHHLITVTLSEIFHIWLAKLVPNHMMDKLFIFYNNLILDFAIKIRIIRKN